MKILYESGENYLEAIAILQEEKGTVRSIDVANHFEFSKASVSRAMKILVNENYITISSEGFINFTDEGKQRAQKIYDRHKTITEFLIKVVNVNKEVAQHDACRIEHVISEETFDAFKETLKNNIKQD